MISKIITQEFVKSQLIYAPETGEFFWRVGGKGRDLTVTAGARNQYGYLVIRLAGERHVASRVAHIYMTGKWPENEMDHVDRDPFNDRWKNLREATRVQNSVNQKRRADNSSGQVGVCWDKQKLKWKVQISVKTGVRLQRHFSDFESACSWYKEMAADSFKDFVPSVSREPSDTA